MADSNRISKYILEEYQKNRIDKDLAVSLIKKINEREDIAVIGMGCRLSEANNYDEFRDLIINKKMTVKRCSKKRVDLIKKMFPSFLTRNELKYSKGSFIEDIDLFDAGFFSLDKEEALLLGPAHRIIIETVYRALEDAGYLGFSNKENKTAIYIGTNFSRELLYSYSGFELQQDNKKFKFEQMLGNWTAGLATRTASILNLKGGAYTIDASCPSSAIAIHNACTALRMNECNMAIAGGVMVDINPIKIMGSGGSMYSVNDDTISRNYDMYPEGAYAGDSSCALLLKPLDKALEDGDLIHGIICGSSFGNNGSDGSFLNSSPKDIKQTVITAIKNSQIKATDIDYIEGEGIVEKIEEGLELSGIKSAFESFSDKRQYCALGSMSPNFGYLQASIGGLQLIKIMMGYKNNLMPPTTHFCEPTDMINFIKSPFFVNTQKREWNNEDGKPRYAAAYGYGYGGHNIFTILRDIKRTQKLEDKDMRSIFVLTAQSKKSFDGYIKNYISYLREINNFYNCTDSESYKHEGKKLNSKINIQNICYTASVCRVLKHKYRLSVIVESIDELLIALENYLYKGLTSKNMYIGINNEDYDKKIRDEISPLELSYSEIAHMFSSGHDFHFDELYKDKEELKCRLPEYPFDKKSYRALKV